MFRFAFLVLAIIGLVSILGGAFGTAAAGIGAFVLIPILIFKLLFVLMIFGCFARMAAKAGGDHRHWGPRRSSSGDQGPSRQERFDEWHRMSHAKEEVDSWVDGMPDVDQD